MIWIKLFKSNKSISIMIFEIKIMILIVVLIGYLSNNPDVSEMHKIGFLTYVEVSATNPLALFLCHSEINTHPSASFHQISKIHQSSSAGRGADLWLSWDGAWRRQQPRTPSSEEGRWWKYEWQVRNVTSYNRPLFVWKEPNCWYSYNREWSKGSGLSLLENSATGCPRWGLVQKISKIAKWTFFKKV